MDDKCFNCGAEGTKLYGYTVCSECKSKLGLLSEKTIKRHIDIFAKKTTSYREEIERRLDVIEKDYIKKRIKLIHVQTILDDRET